MSGVVSGLTADQQAALQQLLTQFQALNEVANRPPPSLQERIESVRQHATDIRSGNAIATAASYLYLADAFDALARKVQEKDVVS